MSVDPIPPAERPKPSRRAGTRLDPANSIGVFAATGKRHGTLDHIQRVYQSGGEAKNFVRRSLQLVSMDPTAWTVAARNTDRLEFIDHTLNQCWCIPTERAARLVRRYDDPKIGPRVGFPVLAFTVVDVDGVLIKAALMS